MIKNRLISIAAACMAGLLAIGTAGHVMLPVYAMQFQYAYANNSTGDVLIRQEPGSDEMVIAVMKNGAICRVLADKQGNNKAWTKIFSGGHTGYVYSVYLADASSMIDSIVPKDGVVIEEDLDIFASPDETSEVIGSRKKGATEILSGTDNADGWSQITFVSDGQGTQKDGWVKSSLIHGDKIVDDAEPYYAVEQIKKDEAVPEVQAPEKDEGSFFVEEENPEEVIEQVLTEKAKEEEVTAKNTERILAAQALRTQAKQLAENTVLPSMQRPGSQTSQQIDLTNDEQSTVDLTKTPVEANDTVNQEGIIDLTQEAEPVLVDTTVSDAVWTGPVLNRTVGTIQGPSGKETYYNLDMSAIVSNIKSHGWIWQEASEENRNNLTGNYWIREDGVKMLGDYVMVAADLDVHPRGSLVQTSLGPSVVVDTGDFAFTNPYQIDVAVSW